MDLDGVLNSLIASGPVAAVLAYAWYRETQRSERLEDRLTKQHEVNMRIGGRAVRALESIGGVDEHDSTEIDDVLDKDAKP